MVVFSLERFIAVYFPFKRTFFNTALRIKTIILLILIGLVLYSINILSTGLSTLNSLPLIECVPLNNWLRFAKFITLFDTILTMFIPFTLITALNILIVLKLTGFSLDYLHPKETPIMLNDAKKIAKNKFTIKFVNKNIYLEKDNQSSRNDETNVSFLPSKTSLGLKKQAIQRHSLSTRRCNSNRKEASNSITSLSGSISLK